MGRRVSLVVALTLAAIVLFAVVVIGQSNGLFGRVGDGGAEEANASQEDLNGALLYLAALSTPAAAPQPQVVTEYVYVDEPAGPPQVTYVTRSAPAAPAAPPPAQASQPPAQVPAAAPTEDEDDPDDGNPATPQPRDDGSPPPPQDDDDDDDGGDDGGGDDEIEFTGTVAAVNGEDVTFSSSGGSTTVRVVSSVGQLEPGMKAKVHAIWVNGGWIAKEIELEDNED